MTTLLEGNRIPQAYGGKRLTLTPLNRLPTDLLVVHIRRETPSRDRDQEGYRDFPLRGELRLKRDRIGIENKWMTNRVGSSPSPSLRPSE